jgi:hypothetical protein
MMERLDAILFGSLACYVFFMLTGTSERSKNAMGHRHIGCDGSIGRRRSTSCAARPIVFSRMPDGTQPAEKLFDSVREFRPRVAALEIWPD